MISPLSKKCPSYIGCKAVFRNEAGMATGIVMLITVMMATMAMAILGLNREHTTRDLRYALFHSMLEVVNINLYAFGQNQRAWDATVNYNFIQNGGKMRCIALKELCTIGVKEAIVLRYPTDATAGSTYYDEMHADANGAGSARDGFKLDGSVCDYVHAQVTGGCALRVRVRWEPFCTANCYVGPNRMIFDIAYSVPINAAGGQLNASFLSVRDPSAEWGKNGPMPIFNPYR